MESFWYLNPYCILYEAVWHFFNICVSRSLYVEIWTGSRRNNWHRSKSAWIFSRTFPKKFSPGCIKEIKYSICVKLKFSFNSFFHVLLLCYVNTTCTFHMKFIICIWKCYETRWIVKIYRDVCKSWNYCIIVMFCIISVGGGRIRSLFCST